MKIPFTSVSPSPYLFTAGFGSELHNFSPFNTAGGAYICNTDGGAFTMTLPATPQDNDYVMVADAMGKFADKNLTVDRNGNNIAGSATDLIVDSNYANFRLTFKTIPDVTSSFIGWLLT